MIGLVNSDFSKKITQQQLHTHLTRDYANLLSGIRHNTLNGGKYNDNEYGRQ